MSTASAVLRRLRCHDYPVVFLGTYVYRFGGIETVVLLSFHFNHDFGTYVYRFGGIETI